RLKIELKSVNHRYLDINIKSPRYLIYLEERIKKFIKEDLSRGKIDVFINLDFINQSSIDVKVDLPLASNFKKELDSLIIELGIDDKVRLSNILQISDIIKTEKKDLDEDLTWETLQNALSVALANITQMREYEGKQLKSDILLKLEEIELITNKIELRAPLVVEEYRIKLNERIKNLMDDSNFVDYDRLALEVAIISDKSSIDEEIIRLRSHINQFREILNQTSAVGIKLDFLIQEFNREINTIGSKSSDSDIINAVVDLKSEVEKIREQIQNIE
ncbi:MAG: YicC family protein, partial [Tissierellia bacterium]|nr:YicC family protein [Tissierellia bacterium]